MKTLKALWEWLKWLKETLHVIWRWLKAPFFLVPEARFRRATFFRSTDRATVIIYR
jgi:hypothetical protein